MNLANFTLGRSTQGGEAIAISYLDEPMKESAVKALKDTGLFRQVKPLHFDVA